MAASIGTYGERALHAALKRLVEPDEARHEQPYRGCIVDVLGDGCVYEVQTRAFERLRGKLARLLPDTPVTLVYPAVRSKWLVWVDPETGEATKKRRSPKTGAPLEVCYELYKLSPLLPHPNLTLWVVPVDVEEYRSLTGWSRDRWPSARRSGCTRRRIISPCCRRGSRSRSPRRRLQGTAMCRPPARGARPACCCAWARSSAAAGAATPISTGASPDARPFQILDNHTKSTSRRVP